MVYWGAGRNSRYSGARRGIEHQGALGVPRGCRGPFGASGGVLGVGRDSRYSGARSIGASWGIGGS